MPPKPYDVPTPQTPREYVCQRAPGPPLIDGRVDKPFWRAAPWTEDFIDIEGLAKPRPRFKTRAKMLWDDLCLYIAAEMEEPHVWGTLTERDSIVYHDNDFEVFLNPTGNNHRYYELEVNARNTIFDLYLRKPYRDGGPADHAWDVHGLVSAVRIDGTLNNPADVDQGWSVEMAIPWTALDRHGGVRCPPVAGDQWRVNFSRVQWEVDVVGGTYVKVPGRSEDNWVWSPQGIVDMHRPEQWGYVQFASGAAAAVFRKDGTSQARWMLHIVYYAQARRHAEQGDWALTLADLGLESYNGLAMEPGSEAAGSGWVARIPVTGGQLCIRQDSLVWLDV